MKREPDGETPRSRLAPDLPEMAKDPELTEVYPPVPWLERFL